MWFTEAADGEWTKHLAAASSKQLEAEVRKIFPNRPAKAIKALLVTLKFDTCRFCDSERRESRRRVSKINRELRQLAGRTDTYRASLGKLSEETRNEFDGEIWPGFEMPENFLAADRPFIKRPLRRRTRKPRKAARTRSRKPAPPSTLFIDPVLVTLGRLRRAIDETIATQRRITARNRGGSPLRLARHNLAWRVALAMQAHLGVKPTPTSEGPFELLFRACLEAGLTTIGSKASPDDLRSYTRGAVDLIKRCGSQA